jgi:hypothetical protein
LKNKPKNFNPNTNTLKTFNLNPTTQPQYPWGHHFHFIPNIMQKNVLIFFQHDRGSKSKKLSKKISLFIIEVSLIIIFTSKVDFEKVLQY